MGYYIDQMGCDITIKQTDLETCLKAIKKKAKSGSWVNDITNMNTIQEVLEEWRWEPDFNKAGDIVNLNFTGEKAGDDETLMNTIAPYVQPGGEIHMKGEEGEQWMWSFNGKTCTEISGSVDWSSCQEIVDAILTKEDLLPRLLGIHPKLDEKIANLLKKDE